MQDDRHMKYLYILYLVTFLFGCSTDRQEQYIPDTVEDAVNYVISNLKEDEIKNIISKSKNEMNNFSLAWNMRIMNSFRIQNNNSKLLQNCGSNLDAFNCSAIIIEGVWKKLRIIRPREEIKGLDETLAMLRDIEISPYQKKNEGIIHFVKYINKEIQNSKYRSRLKIIAKCESSHYRLNNFHNRKKQTVKEFLKYIDFQELAYIRIRPGVVYLTPKPFLNSKPCFA